MDHNPIRRMNWLSDVYGIYLGGNQERCKTKHMTIIGRALDVDGGDLPLEVWGLENDRRRLPTTGINLQLSSTNDGDIGIPIFIKGLDGNGEFAEEVVLCKGQNASLSSQNVFSYIYDAINVGTIPLQGDIYVTGFGDTLNGNGTPSNINDTATFIRQEDNRSFDGFFKVPSNAKACFVLQNGVSVSRTSGITDRHIDVDLMTVPIVGQVPISYIQYTASLMGMQEVFVNPVIPIKISANHELYYKVIRTSANNTIAETFLEVFIVLE